MRESEREGTWAVPRSAACADVRGRARTCADVRGRARACAGVRGVRGQGAGKCLRVWGWAPPWATHSIVGSVMGIL